MILLLLPYYPLPAQARIGLEQYYCTGASAASTPVTRLYYQGNSNWYGELRYNYEKEQAVGISVGRTVWGKSVSGTGPDWSVTPTVGWSVGGCRGVSVGGYLSLEAHQWSFSSAVQGSPVAGGGYWYTWSEVDHRVGGRVTLGAALQQDCRSGAGCVFSPGVEGQLSAGEWLFPVYIFNPLDKRVWLLFGVTREWALHKKIANLKTTPR